MMAIVNHLRDAIRRNPRYAGIPLLALFVGSFAHLSVFIEASGGHLPSLGIDLSSPLVPLLGQITGVGAVVSFLALVILFVGEFEGDVGERENGNESH